MDERPDRPLLTRLVDAERAMLDRIAIAAEAAAAVERLQWEQQTLRDSVTRETLV